MKKTFLFLFGLLICSSAFADFNYDIQKSQTYSPKSTTIGGEMQYNFDYGARTDGQAVYLGNAVRGVATSTASWIIYKFTYASSSDNANVVTRQTAYGSWDNRASLTYA